MPVVCPYCGVCDDDQFTIERPSLVGRQSLNVAHATQKRDALLRRAFADVLIERWGHMRGGCGRWFNVVRDSRTQKVLQTYAIGLPPPDAADP